MSPARNAAKAARSRPAEATGGVGGLATAVAALAGGSVELVGIIGTASAFAPAVVTYLVSHGGVRGVFSAIWRGR